MRGTKGKHWKLSEKTKKKQSKAIRKRHSENPLYGFQGGNKINLGRKLSEKQKKSISIAQLGNQYAKGYKWSLVQRLKISGNNSYRWMGGISNPLKQIRKLPEYKEWHTQVLKRDNYICKICNKRGGKLEVDHYPYPLTFVFKKMKKELFNINNGRTIHKNCHKLTDTYGWKAYRFNPNFVGAI